MMNMKRSSVGIGLHFFILIVTLPASCAFSGKEYKKIYIAELQGEVIFDFGGFDEHTDVFTYYDPASSLPARVDLKIKSRLQTVIRSREINSSGIFSDPLYFSDLSPPVAA